MYVPLRFYKANFRNQNMAGNAMSISGPFSKRLRCASSDGCLHGTQSVAIGGDEWSASIEADRVHVSAHQRVVRKPALQPPHEDYKLPTPCEMEYSYTRANSR